MRIASPGQSFEPPPGCIWCIVGVEDSGKGLTPDELKLLFARFSQGKLHIFLFDMLARRTMARRAPHALTGLPLHYSESSFRPVRWERFGSLCFQEAH